MYCINCGKKINSNGKFCKYCGSLITEELDTEENNTKKLGMKYFDFYSKFYLSFIIIINMLGFFSFSEIKEWNIYTYAMLIIDVILYILLPINLLINLQKKTKFIYQLLLAFLLLDYLYKAITLSFTTYINYPKSSLIEYILISIAMLGVWFIPNLIYFIKRRNIFEN